MFTVEQIKAAHSKVKSGADFPKYIQDIKQLGVHAFETWVIDSYTEYFGRDEYQVKSEPMYKNLVIAGKSDKSKFTEYLKIHQQGKTDYNTFCRHCAGSGIEKWFASLNEMTCTYFDKAGNKVLVEKIPG
jgi:uncharacterized protein YbcV (DUF1398 family)